jgi:hypothetical protein
MSLRVCDNGHVTGYKRCGTCRAKTTVQGRDHSEAPERRLARLQREAEKRIPARGSFELARREAQSKADVERTA